MAKATWINVAGTWKKVINVWKNVGGIWKQKVIPKGNIAGVWKDFMQYLFSIYDNGVENVAVVKGIGISPYSTFTKETNDIKMYASYTTTNGPEEVSAVTDTMVDLTNYTKAKIEFTSSGDPNLRYIIASTNKTGNHTVYTASATNSIISATKVTAELDISALTGNYYIRVHQYANHVDGKGTTSTTMYLYRIWLE